MLKAIGIVELCGMGETFNRSVFGSDGINPRTVGFCAPLHCGYQDIILEDNILAYVNCLDQL
jgi:hypothetical protein